VLEASVDVDHDNVSRTGGGLLVLAGFHRDDTEEDIEYIINKILGLRIFDDERGIMNLSVTDVGGEVMLVSQFTLYGDVRKGKRPSYSSAMQPENASEFFHTFVDTFRTRYDRVQEGVFGADMRVSLVNSGPVTILIDSTKLF